jgi:hypothetical protein
MSYLQEVEEKHGPVTDFSFIVTTDCYQEIEGRECRNIIEAKSERAVLTYGEII